jgi:hypothetical protein
MLDTSIALQRGGGETMPRTARWCAMGLSFAATGTAVSMSVLASWQRGGQLPERLVLVAIGGVLTLSAHLLPALCRSSPAAVRCIGAVLWSACMAACCYSHATFFIMATQHAGQARAAAVAVPTIAAPITSTGRSLSAIASDRAATVAALARLSARRCTDDCASGHASHISLSAKLDALSVESAEAARRERDDDRRAAQEDRVAAQRDGARSDPVTARLAAMIGIEPARVDLLAGMAFALTLECVACFCWMLALHVREPATARESNYQPMGFYQRPQSEEASSNEAVTDATVDDGAPVAQSERIVSDVEQLAQHVAAGTLRATVADIRRHLGCSQQKALALRRQLLDKSQAI